MHLVLNRKIQGENIDEKKKDHTTNVYWRFLTAPARKSLYRGVITMQRIHRDGPTLLGYVSLYDLILLRG